MKPSANQSTTPKGTSIMKRIIVSSFAILLSVALAAPAFAQDNKTDPKKVKTYDFSGDDIDGELIKPDGDFVDTRKFANHTSLIRIRKDFIKEILKSAEDL
jgi:hypothetical protein